VSALHGRSKIIFNLFCLELGGPALGGGTLTLSTLPTRSLKTLTFITTVFINIVFITFSPRAVSIVKRP